MTRDEGFESAPEPWSKGWGLAMHIAGGLISLLSWLALAFVCGLVVAAMGSDLDIVHTGCGIPTSREVRDYKIAVLVFSLLGACVPVIVGLLLRREKLAARPWFALAALVTGVAALLTVVAHPTCA